MIPDTLKIYKERFVYAYTATGVISLLAFGVTPHLRAGNTKIAIIEFFMALALMGNLLAYFKHRNYTILSNIAHFIIMVIFIFLIITGGYKGTGIFWTFSYPLLSFFLNRIHEVIFWNLAFFLSILTIYLVKPDMIYYEPEVLRQAAGVYTAIFILAFVYNSVISKLIKALSRKASFDALTGLYSRNFALETLEKIFSKSPNERPPLILVYIDLDNMKGVNDSLGHDEGDRVLERVAEIIRSKFRKEDIVARFGGDEFVIVSFSTSVKSIEERLIEVKELIEKEFKDYGLSISWGIVRTPEEGDDLDTLIRKADEKMYAMKSAKKS